MKTSDFDYDLPKECIAQVPIEPRDSARLLVIHRHDGELIHATFRELGNFLNPGDLLVLNETRVLRARLYGKKIPTGGRVELLLLRRQAETTWEVVAGAKGLLPGKRIQIEGDLEAEIIENLGGTRRLVRFTEPIEPLLPRLGQVPLPPYIHTKLEDPERYQTVFGRLEGSAAAPTAGLHFTPELINRLQEQGIHFATVMLHVGLDTFAPVTEKDPRDHKIHSEWCQVSEQAASLINQTHREGRRIVAIGTTSVRVLESAAHHARPGKTVEVFEGATDLFILPGFTFRSVDAMVTNFHLPRSTLIMLVSAFLGREKLLSVYREAIQLGYRFYSFGDAMLIL